MLRVAALAGVGTAQHEVGRGRKLKIAQGCAGTESGQHFERWPCDRTKIPASLGVEASEIIECTEPSPHLDHKLMKPYLRRQHRVEFPVLSFFTGKDWISVKFLVCVE
eukprot:6473963-Amphidinium_carterae.1